MHSFQDYFKGEGPLLYSCKHNVLCISLVLKCVFSTHVDTHTDSITLSVQLPKLSTLNLQDLQIKSADPQYKFSLCMCVCGHSRVCIHSAQTYAPAFVSISLCSALRQTSHGRWQMASRTLSLPLSLTHAAVSCP